MYSKTLKNAKKCKSIKILSKKKRADKVIHKWKKVGKIWSYTLIIWIYLNTFQFKSEKYHRIKVQTLLVCVSVIWARSVCASCGTFLMRDLGCCKFSFHMQTPPTHIHTHPSPLSLLTGLGIAGLNRGPCCPAMQELHIGTTLSFQIHISLGSRGWQLWMQPNQNSPPCESTLCKSGCVCVCMCVCERKGERVCVRACM